MPSPATRAATALDPVGWPHLSGLQISEGVPKDANNSRHAGRNGQILIQQGEQAGFRRNLARELDEIARLVAYCRIADAQQAPVGAGIPLGALYPDLDGAQAEAPGIDPRFAAGGWQLQVRQARVDDQVEWAVAHLRGHEADDSSICRNKIAGIAEHGQDAAAAEGLCSIRRGLNC